MPLVNYLNDLEAKKKVKRFLAGFHTKNATGVKFFIYEKQLINCANEKYFNLNIDLAHISEFDIELGE